MTSLNESNNKSQKGNVVLIKVQVKLKSTSCLKSLNEFLTENY